MTTDDQHPTPGTREHFLWVTQLQRWGTIQEYVDLCRTQGYFTPAFYRKTTAHTERIHAKARYGVQQPLFDADRDEGDGDPKAPGHARCSGLRTIRPGLANTA